RSAWMKTITMQPSTVARPGSRHPAYQAFPALLPCVAAAGVVLLSLAVLFGWWQDVTWLQRASPDLAPTLPGTAFSLLLAGASLALSGGRRRWQAWPARLLAGGVLYAGLEALYEALSGQGLLLHPLLLAALRETQAYPMSEVAGLSLLLAGL